MDRTMSARTPLVKESLEEEDAANNDIFHKESRIIQTCVHTSLEFVLNLIKMLKIQAYCSHLYKLKKSWHGLRPMSTVAVRSFYIRMISLIVLQVCCDLENESRSFVMKLKISVMGIQTLCKFSDSNWNLKKVSNFKCAMDRNTDRYIDRLFS